MSKKFEIQLDLDLTLSVEDIWPDGNAPEYPTIEDVRNLIEEEGGIEEVLREWNLLYGVTYSILDLEEMQRRFKERKDKERKEKKKKSK